MAGFCKAKRLLSSEDFRFKPQKSKRFSKHNVTILFQPNNKGFARVGFGFSRKKVKSAVVRNTLKRIGRESFRHQHHQLPAVDILVIARQTITQVQRRELRTTFDTLWQQLQQQYDGSSQG